MLCYLKADRYMKAFISEHSTNSTDKSCWSSALTTQGVIKEQSSTFPA
ncbi:MAG: hypothetical protein HKP31_06420 [Nitrosopumilus sp.]|nr:hypothetical protein [Nitrosopumilus sp.]